MMVVYISSALIYLRKAVHLKTLYNLPEVVINLLRPTNWFLINMYITAFLVQVPFLFFENAVNYSFSKGRVVPRAFETSS